MPRVKPFRLLSRCVMGASIALMLAGCQHLHTAKEVQANIDTARAAVNEARDNAAQPRSPNSALPILDEEPGAWLARRSVAIEESDVLPSRFYQPASFSSGRSLPLSLVIEQIAAKQGITIHVSGDAFAPPSFASSNGDMSRPPPRGNTNRGSNSGAGDFNNTDEPLVQLSYTGNLRGLLDALAGRSGTYWTYREGIVTVSRYKTRTFQIASMPGTSVYTASVGTQSNTGSGGSGGGSSDAMKMTSGGAATVGMQSTLSYWDEINTTIKSMLSPAGKSTSSTVTNAVTVTDTAENIDRIRRFIDRENAVLGRQVSLKVQAYSVKLKKESNSGVDWDVAFKAGGLDFSMGLGGSGLKGGTLSKLGGPWAGSKAMVAALQQQGDVTTVIDTSVVTLNNQPAPLAVTSNLSYIAKLSVTRTAGEFGGDRMYSAEPASLTTGFMMNLLPTLLDNRSVMLQVQLNLSTLLSKKETNVGKDGDGGKITTPETASIQTLQRASLKSGDTLLIAGFKRETNDSDEKGLFDLRLGTKKSTRDQEEFVILITPQLVEGV